MNALRIGGLITENATDPDTLVRAHRHWGYGAAYFPLVADESLQGEMVAALREADIVVAELGAYCINVLDSDPAVREGNIGRICETLALADRHGVLCCVIHGGTVETGGWGAINAENLGQKAFDETVAALQRICDTVAPRRTKLVMEMSSWLFPDGPESYGRILDAADRPQLGVHLDPVNILDSPRACYENGRIIARCFELLGPRIVSCHSKDVWLKNVYLPIEITETYTGAGTLDYDTYLSELARLDHEAPLMLEHLQGHQIAPAMDFLHAKAQSLGLAVRHADVRITGGSQ